MKGYNSVNFLLLGFSIIEIRNPTDLLIMETIKKEKAFDSVKMMREIRYKISFETQNMSLEKLKAYIEKQLTDSKIKLVGQH